ncbi:MAG: TrkH family potassium uptake protein [Christensenellales bacterium]
MFAKIKNKLTNYQIVAIAFFVLILIGTAFLSLPIASKEGETPFIDAFFTATSALCVTGLITFDTFLHWTVFGQIVILILIQIGGLGIMTIMTLFSLFVRRELSLSAKSLFIHSTGSEVGTTKSIIKFIGIGTAIFELLGTIFLSISFCPKMGVGQGLYFALFHSISAFCNAGFDLMGGYSGAFSSLTAFSGDVIVNVTLTALIVIGGLGFLVWSDIIQKKFNPKKFTLHTKIVLVTSCSLLGIGMLLFYLFEMNNTLADKSAGEAFLICLFQSATARTAGYASVNTASLSEGARLLLTVLMFIGGSPGSTAGGIKTTTVVVLLFSVIANVKRKNNITVGKRKIDNSNASQAYAIVTLYLIVAVIASAILSIDTRFTLGEVVFEAVSALGTVGMTLGITPLLTWWGKLVLIFCMFGGRVGMLSLIMIFANKNKVVPLERPTEKIIIG